MPGFPEKESFFSPVPSQSSFRLHMNRSGRFTHTLYAKAYDAGSEVHTESCDHIPGPPCGNPGNRLTEGAEGYVYPHSGIHGGEDLDPFMWDWNNPVALITIERAP